MSKCNRSVCRAEGVYAHVDIVVGHDGKPARYCLACAKLINRANHPMAGYALVPTSIDELAQVLLVKMHEHGKDRHTNVLDLNALAAEHEALAALGRRLLQTGAL